MAYRITLTPGERSAIDWVGDRYPHGRRLYGLVTSVVAEGDEERNPDGEWEGAGDITYYLPEHIAWEMAEAIEENGLACFAPELRKNLYDFVAKIV